MPLNWQRIYFLAVIIVFMFVTCYTGAMAADLLFWTIKQAGMGEDAALTLWLSFAALQLAIIWQAYRIPTVLYSFITAGMFGIVSGFCQWGLFVYGGAKGLAVAIMLLLIPIYAVIFLHRRFKSNR